MTIWMVILKGAKFESTTVFPSHAWKPIPKTVSKAITVIKGFSLKSQKDKMAKINMGIPAKTPMSLLMYSIQVCTGSNTA